MTGPRAFAMHLSHDNTDEVRAWAGGELPTDAQPGDWVVHLVHADEDAYYAVDPSDMVTFMRENGYA